MIEVNWSDSVHLVESIKNELSNIVIPAAVQITGLRYYYKLSGGSTDADNP